MTSPLLINGEIVLYGTVGEQDIWGPHFTDRDVLVALAELGPDADVSVRINSPGGDAHQGIAIYNAFRSHAGAVVCVVDGLAASSASIIAMAGELVMNDGSILMIHDPALFTAGDLVEHEKSIAYLEAQAKMIADIYAQKTGKSPEEIRTLMRAELWMTAAEAAEHGFADTVEGDAAKPATAFNYGLFKNAPEPLKALAKANAWDKPRKGKTPARNTTREREETMTTPDLAATAEATRVARADAAKIIKLCTEAGVPKLAEALVTEGASFEVATAKVNQVGGIRTAVAIARKTLNSLPEDQADQYIAAGKTLAEVNADLLAKMEAEEAKNPTASNIKADTGLQPKKGALAANMKKRLGIT